MRQIIFILSISFLVSCNPSIAIYEKEKLILTIEDFPKKDTTIQVGDFFITYKKTGNRIEGSISSPFYESKGNFKSSSDVRIDISDNQVKVIK